MSGVSGGDGSRLWRRLPEIISKSSASRFMNSKNAEGAMAKDGSGPPWIQKKDVNKTFKQTEGFCHLSLHVWLICVMSILEIDAMYIVALRCSGLHLSTRMV